MQRCWQSIGDSKLIIIKFKETTTSGSVQNEGVLNGLFEKRKFELRVTVNNNTCINSVPQGTLTGIFSFEKRVKMDVLLFF